MARYIFLAATITTTSDLESWVGLEVPDEIDVSAYDGLIPISSLSAEDLASKRIRDWHRVEDDTTLALANLGIVKLPIM